MTIWSNRFRDSALWVRVSDARALVNKLDVPPEDVSSQEILVYVGAVMELIERRRLESDPLEVTPQMLEATSSAVANWVTYLEYVVAKTYTMPQVLDPTDVVMTTLAQWPPMKPARYLAGIQAAVDSFTRKTTGTLTQFAEQAGKSQIALDALDKAREVIEQELSDEKKAVNEAVTDFQLKAAESQQDFQDAQQKKLDGLLAHWAETDSKHRASASALIDTLKSHETTARDTVHATTALTVATDYGAYARNKTWAAWTCDIAGALVGAAGVVAILVHLFTLSPTVDSNVGLSLTRLAASLGTLGIAALLGRRGAQHHREARAAKRTDLALRKVGPFIADLPRDERQLIIQEFTDRVFIRGDLESSDENGTKPGLSEKIKSLRSQRGKSEVA